VTVSGPALDAFLGLLQAAPPAGSFNPWTQKDATTDLDEAAPKQRLERLSRHLAVKARYVLIGEAAGYQGCKVSGIPFTSERLILEGAIPRIAATASRLSSRARPWSEPSATTVWSTLRELGIAEETVLWNAYPWHPFKPRLAHSNRTPTPAERIAGLPVLQAFLALHPRATLLAVGRQSQAALAEVGVPAAALRHPSMGGATRFRSELAVAVRAQRP
jgi:uracil-DNA glycosylase